MKIDGVGDPTLGGRRAVWVRALKSSSPCWPLTPTLGQKPQTQSCTHKPLQHTGIEETPGAAGTPGRISGQPLYLRIPPHTHSRETEQRGRQRRVSGTTSTVQAAGGGGWATRRVCVIDTENLYRPTHLAPLARNTREALQEKEEKDHYQVRGGGGGAGGGTPPQPHPG